MTTVIEASTFAPGQTQPPWFRGDVGKSRDPLDVTAWLWHQTAVLGGFGPSDLEGLIRRWEGVSEESPGQPYHNVYSPTHDVVVALYHPEYDTDHGNRANGYSIGCCIDGKYPGDSLDPDRLACAWVAMIEHARGHGFEPALLEYHRQHSSARGGDPGEDIARIVEEQARVFGIGMRPDHATGSGRTVPDSWRTSASAPLSCSHPTLDIAAMASSSRDESVVDLQALLHGRGYGPDGLLGSDGRPDGKPGKGTLRELVGFQWAEDLTPDGIAGPATWAALFA